MKSNVQITVTPWEKLCLEILAEQAGCSQAEVLRLGLRVLYAHHKKGRFWPQKRLFFLRQNEDHTKFWKRRKKKKL